MEINQNNNDGNAPARRHRRDEDPYFQLRNLLNTIFMLGALAGVAVYLWAGRTAGTIIILVAMLFKIVECVFRLKR